MSESLFFTLFSLAAMAALTAGMVLILFALRVPAEINACPCGYSREGLPAGVLCPECGSSREVRIRPRFIVWKLVLGLCLIGLAGMWFPLLLGRLAGFPD